MGHRVPQHPREERERAGGCSSRRRFHSGQDAGASAELPAAGSSWSLAGAEKGLKIHPWGHVRGLRKKLRHCIDNAFGRGVFCVQTAAIFVGGREDKCTRAFTFQLFPSRPGAWTSSGLIRTLDSFQPSLETQVLPCVWVDRVVLLRCCLGSAALQARTFLKG